MATTTVPPANLSNVELILPTRDSMTDLNVLLGSAAKEFEKSGMDIRTLIEYTVNQWATMKIDEDLIDYRSGSIHSAVTGLAMVDFVIENPEAYGSNVDRPQLELAIRAVVYFVFSEIVPLIEEVLTSPEQLYHVTIIRWMGNDLVIKSDTFKSPCRLSHDTSMSRAILIEQGEF